MVAPGMGVGMRVGDRGRIWMQVVGRRMCRMCTRITFISRVCIRLIDSGACYSRVMIPSKSLLRMSALVYVMHAAPRITVYCMYLSQTVCSLGRSP